MIVALQLQILNTEPGKDRMAYGPHLLLLPAPVLANITLHGERSYGPRLSWASTSARPGWQRSARMMMTRASQHV